MKVEFTNEKTITVTPAKTIPARTLKLKEINILSMIDNPVAKTLIVNTKELGNIMVYQGQSYTDAGQWTDTDVINKIKSMYL